MQNNKSNLELRPKYVRLKYISMFTRVENDLIDLGIGTGFNPIRIVF